MRMIVAEFIARFLRENGIDKVFAIQGSGSARIIDELGKADGIEYICNQHEQASAMSAEGYARAKDSVGCAVATCGPGATNLITGICGSYFDSIPMIYLTGQVAAAKIKGDIKVRCMHTQEAEVENLVRPITKYCATLKKPEDIRYQLEKCLYITKEGRPGPVLLDIPNDFLRVEVDDVQMESFDPAVEYDLSKKDYKNEVIRFFDLLSEAKKPIVLGGYGIHSSKAEDEFRRFLIKTRIPAVFTWGGNDLLDYDDDLRIGTIGMNGSFAGNYALKEADLVILFGARMDHHSSVIGLGGFSKSKKICIDIDPEEIRKFEAQNCKLELSVNSDIKEFLQLLLVNHLDINISDWHKLLLSFKEKDYEYLENYYAKDAIVKPCHFIHELSKCLKENDIIFADTGSSLVWTEQALCIKNGQRLFSSLNNTPMGYSLPASIGAALATNGRVYSINGDGGLQMNLQELATVIRHNLDLKVILFDNSGYGMVQRTQDSYMGSRYEGTDVDSGLAFPDFADLFKVYGFDVTVIDDNNNITEKLEKSFNKKGPGCVIVKVALSEGYLTFDNSNILNDDFYRGILDV